MIWFDKSVMLFGCIVEVFLLFDYFRNFFEYRLKKKTIIITFIITCFALFGINMIGNATINLIMFPLLMWTFVSVLFKSKIGERIGYFVIAYLTMTGVEFLYAILSQTTSGIVLENGVVPVSDYGWQIIVTKFITFIAFLILKQTSDKSHRKMTNKLFYTFQKYTVDIRESARQEVELIHNSTEVERLTKIAEMNDDYSEAVHNMTHSLKEIEQLAMEHNVENIREMVEDLAGRLTQREIYEYSNHWMINTLLSEYVTRAEKNEIKFDVYVEPGCIISQVKDIDIVFMFVHLLDNAFEAASKVDDSSVVFRMFMHEKGKMCIIKVVNDYGQDIIEKNGVVQTTKKEKGIHGIGLKSIAKTAEKYNGIFSYYTEDKKFYAVLILPIE